MNMVIEPSALGGAIQSVASKSQAHRLLTLAALNSKPCKVMCSTTSEDIEATIRCLEALGAKITRTDDAFEVEPIPRDADCDEEVVLRCGESGSTLRFLLPVVGALGRSACFVREGRLAERPLAPLDTELTMHGMQIFENGALVTVCGKLETGRYVLPGNISSQYISGLLLSSYVHQGPCDIYVSTPVQSRPYIELTRSALASFDVPVNCEKFTHEGHQFEVFSVDWQNIGIDLSDESTSAWPAVRWPEDKEKAESKAEPTSEPAPGKHAKKKAPKFKTIAVEGDWSNAAFWFAAGALEREGITVTQLDMGSAQGDRVILAALSGFGARVARKGTSARVTADTPRAATIDVSAIPDLVPPLAVVAAVAPGETKLTNASRLRLKESDRLETVSNALNAMGGNARIEGDDLIICGVDQLKGGVVDAANDHRIAMMAAIMATHAAGPTTVRGAECVAKSYPHFWDDYRQLGGKAHAADAADKSVEALGAHFPQESRR